MKNYKGSYLSYFLMYFFYFFSLAFFSGYISVYLMDKGYTATQVSMVVSCSYITAMIIQPIVGYLNDHYNQKKVNTIILLLSCVLGITFILVDHIYLIALIYSITLGLFNSTNPLIERMATLSKYSYGKIRIWGTIGYAVASKVSGLVYTYIAPDAMYIFFGIGLLICLLGIYGTKNEKEAQPKAKANKEKKGYFDRTFITYLVIILLFYGLTNTNSTYFPAMFQSKGMSMNTISTIVFLLTLSELPIVFFSNKFMNQLSNKQLLLGVFGILLIQFTTYAFITNKVILVIVAILTKAVATMSFIMINLKVVNTIVDSRYVMSAFATVQIVKSFSSIFFQNVAGYMIDFYSYTSFYKILALLTLTAIVICIFYKVPSGKDQQLFN